MSSFTHLHVHSHFSLLGGLASVSDLAQRAASEGLSRLALTDTNALYGAVAFQRACHAAGITPVIGMAVTLAPLPSLLANGDVSAPIGSGGGLPANPGLLTLLAVDPSGYRSLCQIATLLQGSPEREKIMKRGLDWETLAAHCAGLICLSGGRRGWVERLLRAGKENAAARVVGRLAGIFEERTYLALEWHQPGDEQVARALIQLGERFGVPAAAVQPIYCLHPAEASRLRLLAAIDHNCRLSDVPAERLPDEADAHRTLHWLAPSQVHDRFAPYGLAEVVARAGEIADLCGSALPDGRPIWPALSLPRDETPDSALANLAEAGLRDRFGPTPASGVRNRLTAELAAITQHGYSPLFLLVADLVHFARSQDIPVSTRGSVANCLVAYCIGITTVDPVYHDLLFERFLNPARRNPPDIDLDFCSRRRDEVLDYVRRTYGEDRVALVATISTLRPRSAVRETGKAYGLDEEGIDRLVKLLPSGWHPDPRRRSHEGMAEVLAKIDDPRLAAVVVDAFALDHQPHHLSVHPGGIVVSPGPMTDYAPLQWTAKGFLITQFDHTDVEALGLPKVDALGIRALTVLADTSALIRRYHDPEFRSEAIPLDDPTTANLLMRAETIGVFQCESTGARRTLRQLQARTVADLAVANAFFKPGPAMGGMARTFVRRYRGEEPVRYLHPSLEPILGRTRGVLIFQEQILRLAREIAGLSWEQADHLRRGMSKFQGEEMAAMAAAFIAGCQRRPNEGPSAGPGLTAQQAQTLWEQVAPFAGYGFNQGHATAYADVSYRSAYLKAHYPAAFLCARLADWGGFHHPAIYAAEAVRLGIPVRPPHVNHSGLQFTLGKTGAQWVLWMGLGQVRDLRRRSIRAILGERRRQPFTSLRDFVGRVALQTKELLHLIQCGALDGLGESRAALLAEANLVYFGATRSVHSAAPTVQLSFDFLRVDYAPGVFAPEPAAQRIAWERRLLGWPVSVHPTQLLLNQLRASEQDRRIELTPLAALMQPQTASLAQRQHNSRPGTAMITVACRLPGWTGGKGFFIGDGDTYAVAIPSPGVTAPPLWEAVYIRGRWLVDEWGMGWVQIEGVEISRPGDQ